MTSLLDDLKMYARFPFGLREFLNHELTLPEAQRIVRGRLERREENFIWLVEHSIYGYARSPYLALLQLVGCELGDLRALVKQKGLEGALRQLREAGVFLNFEEFKGRIPIVRQGKTFTVQPQDFDNPLTRSDLISESGGSTGKPTRVAYDMAHLKDGTPHYLFSLEAYGTLDQPFVIWRGIFPDGGTLAQLLRREYVKRPTLRWFSNIGWHDSKYWLKYDLATCYMVLCVRLCGASIPFPEFVSTEHAEVIARCVTALRDQYGQCLLSAQVSRALRVSLAAGALGLDLKGVTIIAGGEPPTPAKVSAIVRSGARFFSNYALTEAGTLGYGCAATDDPGDIHFFHDTHALITHPQRVEGFDLTVPAFNLTTLLATAPKIMLNLQIDDYGTINECECGCKLGAFGFTTHLRGVRSYRKLTGEGVTLVGSELERMIEEVLPARFGGSPLDYQWQEREDERGFTRLYLVISPRIELKDEQQVIDTVLETLRASSPMADAARSVWQQAGTLQIKRAEPVWTARGKLMPLHLDTGARQSPPSQGAI